VAVCQSVRKEDGWTKLQVCVCVHRAVVTGRVHSTRVGTYHSLTVQLQLARDSHATPTRCFPDTAIRR